MAHAWQSFPSGTSTGINSTDRTFVDPFESIGLPDDPPATDVADLNSAFSLMKGTAVAFGLTVGPLADVNDAAKIFNDPLVTVGDPEDMPAFDPGTHSAISLMKGILVTAGLA